MEYHEWKAEMEIDVTNIMTSARLVFKPSIAIHDISPIIARDCLLFGGWNPSRI
jgi:hypothetical protein